MEFFDKLVLPQSAEHIVLLHFITIVVQFLFLPFLGLLTAGTLLSVYFKRKGDSLQNAKYLRFAKELIEFTTINKSMGVILGVVPILALLMITAQLLHTLTVGAVWYLFFALVFQVVAVVFIYTYRYSFSFSRLLSGVVQEKTGFDEDAKNDFEHYRSVMPALNRRSGTGGVLFILLATFFLIGGISVAQYPTEWDRATGIMYLLTSVKIWYRWFMFIGIAFALTGSLTLFMYFIWEGGRAIDTGYKEFIRTQALSVVMIGSLVVPLFVVLSVVSLPPAALSISVFFFTFIALLLVFLMVHFAYDMIKNSHARSAGAVLFLVIFVTFSIIMADQSSVTNATRPHSAVLAKSFEEALKQLEKEAGGTNAVSGVEVFKARCASCHRFDQKVVGPPYKQTMPKYEGNEDKLVAFIKNPVKVDPAYPPMPNPGLKPAEARAVAKYILEEYKKY